MKSVILNASFAFFIAVSSTAHAQPAAQAEAGPRIVVSYGDLDLSRESGARVMLSRLEAASRAVCGGWPDLHNLGMVADYRACRQSAMEGAVARLGSPKVSALYGIPAERLASNH